MASGEAFGASLSSPRLFLRRLKMATVGDDDSSSSFFFFLLCCQFLVFSLFSTGSFEEVFAGGFAKADFAFSLGLPCSFRTGVSRYEQPPFETTSSVQEQSRGHSAKKREEIKLVPFYGQKAQKAHKATDSVSSVDLRHASSGWMCQQVKHCFRYFYLSVDAVLHLPLTSDCWSLSELWQYE